eukprot:jgi/Mesen1/2848/ME000174S02101
MASVTYDMNSSEQLVDAGMPVHGLQDVGQNSLQHPGDGSESLQGFDGQLTLQGDDGGDEQHQMEEDEQDIPRTAYGPLSIHDILPIETARVRFLRLLVDHFVTCHVVPAGCRSSLSDGDELDKPEESFSSKDSARKRRKLEEQQRHIQEAQLQGKTAYEGDPSYLLPLIFVANMYESLVGEINARMSETQELAGKSMGLALEAAGGLYRKLVEKYPKSGGSMWFKRREMASALEARTKFPQLVSGDEKRVRFIVVHGLEIVERPSTMGVQDAEWFKRITGRQEACIYPRDYKFFSARTKTRRQPSSPSLSQSLHLMPGVPTGPHGGQVNGHAPQHHQHHSPPPSMSSGPAKFCDECGAAYVRDASKFCSECGTKRLGI